MTRLLLFFCRRRALEKADGHDVIFDKHMTERTGKYIVFLRKFRAYAGDDRQSSGMASKAFYNFKADSDTEHLKLLHCIDALNDWIHADDVSGVILLRQTVSPIIYKQQTGRALAAGKNEILSR